MGEQRQKAEQFVNNLALPLLVVLVTGLTSVIYSSIFVDAPELKNRVVILEEKTQNLKENQAEIKKELKELNKTATNIYRAIIDKSKN